MRGVPISPACDFLDQGTCSAERKSERDQWHQLLEHVWDLQSRSRKGRCQGGPLEGHAGAASSLAGTAIELKQLLRSVALCWSCSRAAKFTFADCISGRLDTTTPPVQDVILVHAGLYARYVACYHV